MIRNSERKIGKGVFWLFILCLVLPTDGWAQTQFPNRPITLLVGYTAGGLTDVTIRAVAESASKIIGQPIVVTNKPGAATAVSLAMVKDAKPDGYTLGYYSGSTIMNKYLLKNIPYDPINDFTPIADYAESGSGLIVGANSPWKTHQEFISYAKANPNKIRFATIGPSSHYISIVTLGMIEGIQWIHVPFKGSNTILTALMGGHIEAGICSPEWVPHVQAGRLRLLSIASSKRMPKFPNIPTWTELGFPFTNKMFCSIAGPKGMPKPIVDKLSQAIKEALNDPSCQKTLSAYELIPDYLNSEQLLELWKERDKTLGELIPKLGMKKE
jgi:tripartite-type tricarboxylate transporter receptor subunit TctC